MYISYRQDPKNLVIPITKISLSKSTGSRRQFHNRENCSTKRNVFGAKKIIVRRTLRHILTLSPKDHRKLSLKYENVHNIKLYPDTIIKHHPSTQNVRSYKIYQFSPIVADTAAEEREQLLQNFASLLIERETLTSMKALLEERLRQEQKKYDNLKNYNENLKFDLSNAATKTLELSIDTRNLEDEIQRITWQWNSKFVQPKKIRKICKYNFTWF